MVATGFKRDKGGAPPGFLAGVLERMDLGMSFTGTLMPAFADDLLIAYQDTTHARIGIGGVKTAFCQLQGMRHVTMIIGSEAHQIVRLLVFIIRQQGLLLAFHFRRGNTLELLDLFLESADILETAIHRGKPDIRHLIEIA